MDHPFRFEVVNWRSHAIPGAGQDPQAVINATMPDQYDVFVGIMWARFGTPTGRAGSGTEEEFERARSQAGKESAPAILFYFKDEPIPPSKVDLEQLACVLEFKDRLAKDNLYWDFKNADELAKELRVHLGRTARRLMEGEAEVLSRPVDELEDEDDLGFLDLLEDAAEAAFRGNEAVQRMTADTTALGSKITARNEEMKALPSRHGNVDVRAARRLGDRIAADMNAFAERLETEVPIMGDAYGTTFDATTKAISLLVDFSPDDSTDLLALRTNVSNLAEALGTVIDQQGQFRLAVARLPRLTRSMTMARRRTLAAMEEVTTRLQTFQSMAGVLLRLLDETIVQIEGSELTCT